MNSTPLNKDDYLKIIKIIEEIEQDPKSEDFKMPVDYIAWGLTDYPEIVKHPMDLSTVKKKLSNQKYNALNEVFDDLQLIWNNCKTYNKPRSPIFKLAIHCENLTNKIINKYFNSNNTQEKEKSDLGKVKKPNLKVSKNKDLNEKNIPTSPPKVVSNNEEENDVEMSNLEDESPEDSKFLTVNERDVLSKRIKCLVNDGLAAMVRLVQKECPNAIEDLNEEKLQIKLTEIDRKTYGHINALIDTFLKVKERNQENIETKKRKIE